MCSWCYGFHPQLEKLLDHYQGDFKLKVMMGGLRTGDTHIIDATMRETIFSHWRRIQELTGRLFKYENALADGTVYNTGPSRSPAGVRIE